VRNERIKTREIAWYLEVRIAKRNADS